MLELPHRAAAALGLALFSLLLLAAATAPPRPVALPTFSPAELQLGRRLVAFGACNDCHTPGWRESDGKLPEKAWLTGSPIGFRGAWGTAYPANVRLVFQEIDEGQWLNDVRTRGGHPPMTWHDLRALDEPSLRAIYRFVRSLGPAGAPAPTAVPPGREPEGIYYDVAPQGHAPAPPR